MIRTCWRTPTWPPLTGLADHAELAGVRPGGPCGANATEKVASLIASMAAGADSIGDMDLLRGGAMGTVVSGVRAPSRLGSPLYSYKWRTSASSTNL
jgi:hypothetical protein